VALQVLEVDITALITETMSFSESLDFLDRLLPGRWRDFVYVETNLQNR